MERQSEMHSERLRERQSERRGERYRDIDRAQHAYTHGGQRDSVSGRERDNARRRKTTLYNDAQ